MSHRSSWLCFSLCQGLKEAREQTKRCSQAACNILPSLESADGIDLRHVDNCSQGFQSGAASLADLPRQSDSVRLNTGCAECYNPFPKTARAHPRLGDARPGHLPDARSSSAMYLASGTSATSPAPPPRPPALQHGHQLAGAFQNQHARSLRSPQHRRSPSELSSKTRLKPVWTSKHFSHLPLSQRFLWHSELSCTDQGTDPPSHAPRISMGESRAPVTASLALSLSSLQNSSEVRLSTPLTHANTWLICTYPCSAPFSDQQDAAEQETSPDTASLITQLRPQVY